VKFKHFSSLLRTRGTLNLVELKVQRLGAHCRRLKIGPTQDQHDGLSADVYATAGHRPMSRLGEKHAESPTNHKCSTQNCTTHPLHSRTQKSTNWQRLRLLPIINYGYTR